MPTYDRTGHLWPSRVFWFLLAAFLGIILWRIAFGHLGLDALRTRQEYAYEQTITVYASPGDFSLSAYIPQNDARTTIREERLDAPDLPIKIEEEVAGRFLVLDGRRHAEPRVIRYTAMVEVQSAAYRIPENLSWADIRATQSSDLDATDLIQTGEAEISALLGRLLEIPAPDMDRLRKADYSTEAWRSLLETRGTTPYEIVTAIFDQCQNRIASSKLSGTTDAVTALRLGEASCGGKSRLMVALARTAGIPGRLVGGVILGNARRKRTSHVWLELRLGDQWVPFDPLNNHFASTPSTFLTLYRGDEPAIRHSRGLSFDYGYASRPEVVPAAWAKDGGAGAGSPHATRRVPLLERSHFSIILLAPFALLLVVFCRQVLGFDSIGLFLPVLLGFTITQTGWLIGGVQVLAAILLGISLRFGLTHLNLLYVPRIAFMITFVVIVLLVSSTLLTGFGEVSGGSSLVVPLAALAMTIERFTAAALDRGNRPAVYLLLQTFVLAVGCYFVLTIDFFKSLTVTFPEILLLVMAEIVMVGNYRGLKLREHWRFRRLLAPPREEATTP